MSPSAVVKTGGSIEFSLESVAHAADPGPCLSRGESIGRISCDRALRAIYCWDTYPSGEHELITCAQSEAGCVVCSNIIQFLLGEVRVLQDPLKNVSLGLSVLVDISPVSTGQL